jgi:hypothetical protein
LCEIQNSKLEKKIPSIRISCFTHAFVRIDHDGFVLSQSVEGNYDNRAYHKVSLSLTIFAEFRPSRIMPCYFLRPALIAAGYYCLFVATTTTSAFQPASQIPKSCTTRTTDPAGQAAPASTFPSVVTQHVVATKKKAAASAAATVALSAILFLTTATTPGVLSSPAAWAAETTLAATDTAAAQITLNRLPPSTISVQIKDLPVVGSLLSGSYSKLPDSIVEVSNSKNPPSVIIKSPVDKVKAIASIVKNGHLEFDIHGLIENHVDVDISAEKAGVMTVRVASDLIPKLPFTNVVAVTGGKESPWNSVTNMGSGEVYYYNEKTGVTQYTKPSL